MMESYADMCLLIRTGPVSYTHLFVRNHHPAIVDEDLFEKAQEVVKVNSDLYNRTRSGKKPRAFSQRLICGECGRFFHVTNGNGNYPIWRCPTSSRTTGKRICHAEKVYEEQVVRAFRKAVLERFRLTLKPCLLYTSLCAGSLQYHRALELDAVQCGCWKHHHFRLVPCP